MKGGKHKINIYQTSFAGHSRSTRYGQEVKQIEIELYMLLLELIAIQHHRPYTKRTVSFHFCLSSPQT